MLYQCPPWLPLLNNIYSNHATNTSTHQHHMYLHSYQQQKSTGALPLTPTNPPTIYPPTKPTTPFDALPVPAYIVPNDDNHDDTTPSRPTLPAILFHSPHGPANISCQALYHVINLAFNAPPAYTIPQASASLPIVFTILSILRKCATVSSTLWPKRPSRSTPSSWTIQISKNFGCLQCPKNFITLSFFSPMTKSGVSPRTAPSPTCAL